MKKTALLLLLAATAAAATAQTTPAKPAAAPAKASPASGAKTAAPAAAAKAVPAWVKLPKGIPPVKGAVVPAFTLRYQEIKLGTGTETETQNNTSAHHGVAWNQALIALLGL